MTDNNMKPPDPKAVINVARTVLSYLDSDTPIDPYIKIAALRTAAATIENTLAVSAMKSAILINMRKIVSS